MPLPFQPVPNTVEIAVQGTLMGQQVENKFYAQAAEAITSSMVNELAGIAADWVTAHFLANVPAAYNHTRVVARDLTSESSFETVDSSAAGPGTNSGTYMAGNVTAAVHRATIFSGKKQKSRIYHIAPMTGFMADNNDLSTAGANALIVLYDQLRTAILAGTEGTYTYGYPQRIIDGVRLATANFIEVVGHTFTDKYLDSQRRRLPGRGS